jgi:PKD repeat protein
MACFAQADFTATPTSGSYPLTVQFNNTSVGFTSYSWTFGDGNSSTASSPANTYVTNGLFTVTLTAVSATDTNVMTKPNFINVGEPPTTNNLTVILPAGANKTLRQFWRLDTQSRTNGTPPYNVIVPAQTFKEFLEGLASDGLVYKMNEIIAIRDGEFLQAYKDAPQNKKIQAMKALQ